MHYAPRLCYAHEFWFQLFPLPLRTGSSLCSNQTVSFSLSMLLSSANLCRIRDLCVSCRLRYHNYLPRFFDVNVLNHCNMKLFRSVSCSCLSGNWRFFLKTIYFALFAKVVEHGVDQELNYTMISKKFKLLTLSIFTLNFDRHQLFFFFLRTLSILSSFYRFSITNNSVQKRPFGMDNS